MTFVAICVALLAVSHIAETMSKPSRIVLTKYGMVQGSVVQMPGTLQPVEMYLGIPYASPPTGTNRFSPTRTTTPWSGIKMALNLEPVCPQAFPKVRNETEMLNIMPKLRLQMLKRLELSLLDQSEDCLYLNIYSPVRADRLPVIVFIHGESFSWNSGSSYNGTTLASYTNSIVVTLNFRIGIFGFFNVGRGARNKGRLSNFGLMDQIAALHWVKENVASFGGDQERITLMGHGTGAAFVHYITISPALVPGLFHRAVLMSGSAFSPWALVDDPEVVALRVAKASGCISPASTTITDWEGLISCLRDISYEALLEISANLGSMKFKNPFAPSVDNVVIRTDFRTTQLRKRSDPSLGIDLLFGTSQLDGAHLLSDTDCEYGTEMDKRDSIFREMINQCFKYHQQELFISVTNEYTDWEMILPDPIAIRDATVEALTDSLYIAPVVEAGNKLGQFGSAFMYSFEYVVNQRIENFHGFDLALFLGAPIYFNSLSPDQLIPLGYQQYKKTFTKQEQILSEILMNSLANFVRSGNPNYNQEISSIQMKDKQRQKNVAWEPYDPVKQKFLELGSKTRMRSHLRARRIAFWQRLVPELHRAGKDDPTTEHGSDYPLPATSRNDTDDSNTTVVTCPSATLKLSVNQTVPEVKIITSNEDHNVYSTALSLTIAIGCSLLILNVLMFAALYYKRDQKRNSERRSSASTQSNQPISASGTMDTSYIPLMHGAPVRYSQDVSCIECPIEFSGPGRGMSHYGMNDVGAVNEKSVL